MEANEEAGERIMYSDVVSLYPFICQQSTQGLGHPDVLLEPDIDIKNIDQYFGVMSCVIEPPEEYLHLPVLPYRVHNKLIFGLCATCMRNMSQDPCTCAPEERRWTTTAHTLEISLAVRMGYKVIRAFELYNYPPERRCTYDRANGVDGIFGSYIDHYTKVKIESSGFPPDVRTDADKKAYVRRVKDETGIDVCIDRIHHNAGMRYLAKGSLNSVWGKFGERQPNDSTKVFGKGDLAEFLQCFTNPETVVRDFHIRKDTVTVTLKRRDETPEHCAHSNMLIACTVTSTARTILYDYMSQVSSRVAYCDTDSVFWMKKEGLPEIECTSLLGQMKDELGGLYIKLLICLGPKAYSYIDSSGSCTTKVKGFTLCHSASQKINFESLLHMLKNEPDSHISTLNPRKIKRDKVNCKIYTTQEAKQYRLVSDKRVFFNDFTSKPYGYRA